MKKIVFRAYLREKWIDLHQSKTKLILDLFYKYCQIHFSIKNQVAENVSVKIVLVQIFVRPSV